MIMAICKLIIILTLYTVNFRLVSCFKFIYTSSLKSLCFYFTFSVFHLCGEGDGQRIVLYNDCVSIAVSRCVYVALAE